MRPITVARSACRLRPLAFVLCALLFAAAALGACGSEPTPEPAPASTPTPEPAPASSSTPTPPPSAINTTVREVLAAYISNKFQADKLYKFSENGGRELRIEGYVEAVEHEFVTLSASTDLVEQLEFEFRLVACYYEDKSLRERLRKGEKVTFVGRGEGEDLIGIYVDIQNCRFP